MRLIVCALLVCFSPLFAEEIEKPVSAEVYLVQAKEILAKARPTLVGTEAEKLDKAIATLDVLMAKQPDVAEKLDVKALRTIIGAKFLAKGTSNDELTISYAVWDNASISDWVVTGSAPTIVKGALSLEPSASCTNKIHFKTMSLQGEIMCANKEGNHLASTGGFAASVSNYNAWSINFQVNGTKVGSAAFDKAYTQTDGSGVWIPFTFKVEKGTATLTWKGQKLAGQMPGDFGSLVLLGGNGGNQFRGITLIGTVDRSWVKAALQQKALDDAAAVKKK